MKPLGETQRIILRSIVEHKGWEEGCGWIWGNYSTTVRLLGSLVKRGLVMVELRQRKFGRSYHHYSPTEAGIVEAKKEQ